jgi:hypothetical protein
MSATIRVTVGNVRHEKAKHRYRLDWTIYVPDDKRPKRNKLATHPDKDELRTFRTDLLRAIERNRPVDLGTGLPEGVERPHQRPTIQDAASRPLWLDIRDRVHEKWDGEGCNGERKGHTVKGWANEWVAFILAFLRADAAALTRKQREGARDYLRRQLVPAEVWERLAALDEQKRQLRRAGGPKDKQERYRWPARIAIGNANRRTGWPATRSGRSSSTGTACAGTRSTVRRCCRRSRRSSSGSTGQRPRARQSPNTPSRSTRC